VACIAHTDCQDPARPECDANQCSPCTSDAACSSRMGKRACDAARASSAGSAQSDPSAGMCVECTSSNISACSSGLCDPTQHQCAAAPPPGGLCATCSRDRDCADGRKCTTLRFAGGKVGSYCVRNADNVCATGCALGFPLGCN
jgi:hypothetical protein